MKNNVLFIRVPAHGCRLSGRVLPTLLFTVGMASGSSSVFTRPCRPILLYPHGNNQDFKFNVTFDLRNEHLQGECYGIPGIVELAASLLALHSDLPVIATTLIILNSVTFLDSG